jgi:hypothetical protein
MSAKNTRTKNTVTVLIATLLIGLIIGITLGIQLYQVSITKLGFWQGDIESTNLSVLTIRHQIQSATRIRTIVQMRNTGTTTITCNCTLYYKDTSGDAITTRSFNTTINPQQTKDETLTVTPIDINEFAGTDLSVFEY